jgi:predicted permease
MRRAFRLGLGDGHIAGEVDDELAFHVDMRTRKLIDTGMPAADARAEALRQFGELRRVRQSCITLDEERERTMKRIRYADELRQDISFAARALRRNPAFTAVAVFTLALGIGANTAIFTLIDSVMLRPIPVHAPEELITIGDASRINWESRGSAHTEIFSYPLYRDLVEHNTVLSGLAASGVSPRIDLRLGSGTGGEAEHPAARLVSANYFNVLGVPAARGRLFGPAEDGIAPTSPVAVISDQYWTMHFDRDPGIAGRQVVVNNVRLTIIGVTPPGFEGEVVGTRYDIWFPLSLQPALRPHDSDLLTQRNDSWLLLIGRRAPRVTFEAAQAGIGLTLRQALHDHAGTPSEVAAVAKLPLLVNSGAHGFSAVRHNYRGPLLTMLGGVALLLLIICANVANLLLARAVARTPEFSVRLAMGAGRGRLLRQLLTESAVLAVVSAGVGLTIAWAGSRALLLLAADGGPAIPLDVRMDLSVLAFTLAMSIASVALFGLLPAFRTSRLDLAANLRARGVTSGLGARGQRFPIGTVMITGQIALSLVLLVSAALLVRNLRALEATAVNVDRDHLLMVTLDITNSGLHGLAVHREIEQLRTRFATIPGVAAVSYSQNGIFNGSDVQSSLDIPHWTGRSHADSVSHQDFAGPGYIGAIGGRILSGRDFTPQDMEPDAAQVTIVNQSFARFYYGNEDPIGRSVGGGTATPATIVGVVADVRDRALDDAPIRRFYIPFAADTGESAPGDLNFAIRTNGDPSRVVAAVRRTAAEADGNLKIDGATPLAVLMKRSIAEQRMLARVASGFGLLALLLAALGLYGIMTYAVTRRTGEIGLRIALGAEPRAMVVMVVRDALALVLVGTLIGIPLALASARLLRSQLNGIEATDPVSAGVALVVLGAAAVLAALVPALRAARIEPLAALQRH